ncbi:MAG: DUF2269 family protein, partial [Acidimicrobiales bacterium]
RGRLRPGRRGARAPPTGPVAPRVRHRLTVAIAATVAPVSESIGYRVLVMLHLICVIGGFGLLAYSGLYLSLARRRGPDAAGLVEVNRLVSALAEMLVYGAVLFALAAVGLSPKNPVTHKHVFSFSQTWVWLAFVLYLVAVGLLHGFIRPRQRQYALTMAELSSNPETPSVRPPQVARLDDLEKRIGLGWGVFNVVVLVVVYLMVFKPGS